MSQKLMNGKTLNSGSKDFEWKYDDISGLEMKRIFKGDIEAQQSFQRKILRKLSVMYLKMEKLGFRI